MTRATVLNTQKLETALLFCLFDQRLARWAIDIAVYLILGREQEGHGNGVVLRRILLAPVATGE